MTYKIDVQYLEHDGGTKFYETVLIQEEDGPGMLIKRYGSIDKKMGGGQTIIERGSHVVVANSAVEILNEKQKYRSGKGQYRIADRLNYGLQTAHDRDLTATELAVKVAQHYKAADCAAIKAYFGIGTAKPERASEEPAPAPAVSEEPVIRDASWGSW